MNVESAMWTSGYLFDYQKQKIYIYGAFVQEKASEQLRSKKHWF